MPFAGKSVLVTGAARGIGAATAEAFARAGADVALCDLADSETAAAPLRALGRRALALRCDVADPAAMQAAVDRTVAEFGALHVFVANAAYQHRGPFWELPLDECRRVVEVGMWGPFHGLRSATVQMMRQPERGNIVIVSSGQAELPAPLSMPYNMAKAAIDHMARTAAVELLPHRIRVNVVHPGWTDTPGERKFYTEDALATVSTRTPPGRMMRPEEVARGILFLADADNEFLNGVTLPVGAGTQMPRPWNT